jgi:hypothetical protein
MAAKCNYPVITFRRQLLKFQRLTTFFIWGNSAQKGRKESQQRTVQNAPALIVQPRFFVAPTLDERLKEIVSNPPHRMKKRKKRTQIMMRYAVYLRISSEEQIGNYSIEAQRRAVQTWVQAQSGQLVTIYTPNVN